LMIDKLRKHLAYVKEFLKHLPGQCNDPLVQLLRQGAAADNICLFCRPFGFVHESYQMSGIFYAGIAGPFRFEEYEFITPSHNKVNFSPSSRPVMVKLAFSQIRQLPDE
ncbi:MAG: hypothetical protein KA771_09085, partial [Spirochaetales bacterium]|nr:hypothetical protein [Spirochaetales bacterium]